MYLGWQSSPFNIVDPCIEYVSNMNMFLPFVSVKTNVDVSPPGEVLAQFCGRTTETVTTSDSFAFIRFHSDERVTSKGFRITFTSSVASQSSLCQFCFVYSIMTDYLL